MDTKKKVVVRQLESTELRDGCARLHALAKPDQSVACDANWRPSIYRFLESHPLADEMHRWVVDAEGEIVGHLAALPQYYRIDGRRVVAHTPAEYMILPKYGFHAITLMREFFRTCENCVSDDTHPAVISLQTRLGPVKEAGKVQFAAKLWDVRAIPGFPTSIPMGITQVFNWGLQAVDRALNATRPVEGLRVEMLEGFDETFDELFESVAATVPCVLEKDAAFLQWRYGPGSPQESATVLVVKDGEERLLGYAVFWLTADGHRAYLLDLTTRPARHDVALALLHEVVRRLRRLRVRSVTHRFVESPTSPRSKDMPRVGLFQVKRMRSTLFVKFAESALYERANSTARWSYSHGDGEGSYWIR